MTRTVTAHLFSAVNGVVESPHEWQFGAFGPEEIEMMGNALSGVSDVVIGRKLWQEWSEHWSSAGADDPFAAFINPVRKHVVSTTVDDVSGWSGSVAIDGDPVDHVRALKAGEGGRISVVGGIETVRSLFLAGVVDALTLTVHPAVGVGRRLFDESVPITRLELVEAVGTSAGNAVLTYRLRQS